jgi:dUTP pyrophosphatase
MNLRVKIKRLHDAAVIPQYQSQGAAGFDLHAVGNHKVDQGERVLIPIGLSFELPPNFELQLRPRSGLAWRNGISLTNSPATIDSDFRGEVQVILENRGDGVFFIDSGDRIAQAVIAPVEQAHFVEVDELGETSRGSNGFGSSGVKANG